MLSPYWAPQIETVIQMDAGVQAAGEDDIRRAECPAQLTLLADHLGVFGRVLPTFGRQPNPAISVVLDFPSCGHVRSGIIAADGDRTPEQGNILR